MLRIDRVYMSLMRLEEPAFTASILSVLVFSVSVCGAQNTPAPTPADIFRQARSSVVLIVGSASGDNVAQGSGFIVGKDKIVTNYHVIAGLSLAYVLFADGRTEPVAGVVAADADQDAAVLEVHTGTRLPLALGDELNLHEGDSVLAIGAPRGLELSLTNGIISAFRTSEKKFLIQNTAPIAPGSSGGPLLDSRGRAVGLTTSLLADTPGVYFSIGIGAVKRLLKAAPTMSQSFAEWTAKKAAQPRVAADTVCSFITSKMMSALPTVPTVCVVKEDGPLQYELRVFSPTEVLEGKMRRAWATVLFQTGQALFFDGALNGTCELSLENKHWHGCQLDVSDSYLSQRKLYYSLVVEKHEEVFMQAKQDPSSDDWYVSWWELLLFGQKADHPQSKDNAEWIGKHACEDYVQAIAERFKILNKPLPSCSVLLATDTSLYLVIDFHDWLEAAMANSEYILPRTIGRAFESTGYDGEVIFRSPWISTNYGESRVYRTYPLRNLEFCFAEIRSGTRDEAQTGFLLATRYAGKGQTERYVLLTDPKKDLVIRHSAVVRITLVPEGDSLMDLTDGSEWSLSNKSQGRCNLAVGTEVFILASGDKPPSVTVRASGEPCRLDAAFAKGW